MVILFISYGSDKFFLTLLRPSEKVKTPSPAFSVKLSSDAVTQITTESPDKTLLSSEIFITDKNLIHTAQDPKTQKKGQVPMKFASSSSIQKISVPRGPDGKRAWFYFKFIHQVLCVVISEICDFSK